MPPIRCTDDRLRNELWGRGSYINLFSPSDVTALHRILDTSIQKHNFCYAVHFISDANPCDSVKLGTSRLIQTFMVSGIVGQEEGGIVHKLTFLEVRISTRMSFSFLP